MHFPLILCVRESASVKKMSVGRELGFVNYCRGAGPMCAQF